MPGSGNVLIINAGSSSVRYVLYVKDKPFLEGKVDLLEEKMSYKEAGQLILKKIGTIPIQKVAHRVVYSNTYKNHVVITQSVLENLEKIADLDPLHMPPALELIKLFSKLHVKQIACFDTVFHQTMPAIAKTYPIPKHLAKKYNIVRHGFHGLSHEYMMHIAKEQSKKHDKIITCQLGNGASISAIKKGKCIDTTMGFTPLEGLMMGTRSGSIDPSIVSFIAKKEKISSEKVIELLNKESGLKAIGGSADVRVLLRKNDADAKLAIDMFAYQVKKQIGAYIMALDGVDVIVFAGGISKNQQIIDKILDNACMKGVKIIIAKTNEEEIMYSISKQF